MADRYDEASMNNGPVGKQGTFSPASSAPSQPSGSNRNPATSQADGTASPRIVVETKDAPDNSTPSGGKNQWPSAVASYEESEV